VGARASREDALGYLGLLTEQNPEMLERRRSAGLAGVATGGADANVGGVAARAGDIVASLRPTTECARIRTILPHTLVGGLLDLREGAVMGLRGR
jgi:hypothetical protein